MTLLSIFSAPTWAHLVAALLHTLWIGLLAAVAAGAVLRCATRPQPRQLACIAGLLLTLIGGYLSWSLLDRSSANVTRPASVTATQPVSETIITDEAPIQLQPTQYSRPSAAPAPRPAVRTTTWIAAGWLIGVTAMLIRMTLSIAGAGRLRRRGTPLSTDHPVSRLLSELQTRLGAAKRIPILLVDALSGPAVIGIVRPVILWPLAWATGLPEWQVRAMLAHELAHIVRRDYLVNLLQMIIEAILFFNPAVWWMSRQLRLEREACCDAFAGRLLGKTGEYDIARALAEISGALPTGALAFGDDQPGPLLGRIRRLLNPGHRPGLRLPWPALLGLLALILVALTVVKVTSDTVADKLMNHRERIARMEKLKEQTPDYSSGFDEEESQRLKKEGDAIISGTIRMADGGKLPPNLKLHACSSRPQHETFSGGTLLDMPETQVNAAETEMAFSLPLRPGKIDLILTADGCAPKFVGPLTAEPGEDLDPISFTLDEGFHAAILLTDTSGNPIPNATIDIQSEDPTQGWRPTVVTVEDGKAIIEHATAEIPIEFQVRHPGFMEDIVKHVTLQANKPYIWTLKKASPTTGRVVDDNGNPLAGVEIYLKRHQSEKLGSMSWPSTGPLVATSDANGHFSIDTLESSGTYTVQAQTPDRSHIGFNTLTAGETDRTLTQISYWPVEIGLKSTFLPRSDAVFVVSRVFPTRGFRCSAYNLLGPVDDAISADTIFLCFSGKRTGAMDG